MGKNLELDVGKNLELDVGKNLELDVGKKLGTRRGKKAWNSMWGAGGVMRLDDVPPTDGSHADGGVER